MEYSCKIVDPLSGEKGRKNKSYGFFENNTLIARCTMKDYGDDSFYLMNVAVFESHRGKGLCYKFLKCVLDKYKDKTIYLSVLIHNIPANKCYNKLGFVEIDRGIKTIFMCKNCE
jgi:RimJ/RimL family protein N-acetyltransferase